MQIILNMRNEWFKYTLRLLIIVTLATLTGGIFNSLGFPETNIVVIYLLAVMLVAKFTVSYQYGILSAVISLLCYNYFFTAPYHTLAVDDPSYLITFSIMLITSILTSAMTSKEKLSATKASEASEENKILYMLSNRLSDASDYEEVMKIASESISHLLQVNVGCIYIGKLHDPTYIQKRDGEFIHRYVNNPEGLRLKFTDLRDEYLEEDDGYCYPVNGREHLLAIIIIDKNVDKIRWNEKKKMLHSIIENISVAMDRIEVTIERIRDKENMERERDRANLLRAISHDLRTPLSGIMGTSEMLLDMEDDKTKKELISGIYQDADWLKSLVENILSLTRLQDGKIVVHKEMEAIEEIIASSVAHIEKIYRNRTINVKIPESFVLVPMDARLIEQVITNLLDNAVKHTDENEMISVEAEYEKDNLVVRVIDEGDGIADSDLDNIFKIFYTSDRCSSDVKRGIGLGLTICETVIKAHGGTIRALNRNNHKGAEFIFTLPLA